MRNTRKRPLADVGYAALLLLMMACTMAVSEPARADINNCSVTLSPTEHNYGDLRKDSQSFISTAQGNATTLAARSSNLNITCPDEERMVISFTGLVQKDGSFGWGTTGKVDITLGQATLDGNAVQLTRLKGHFEDAGAITADSQALKVSDEIGVGNNTNVKGKSLNAVITVTPHLLESSFTVPDAVPLQEIVKLELIPLG